MRTTGEFAGRGWESWWAETASGPIRGCTIRDGRAYEMSDDGCGGDFRQVWELEPADERGVNVFLRPFGGREVGSGQGTWASDDSSAVIARQFGLEASDVVTYRSSTVEPCRAAGLDCGDAVPRPYEVRSVIHVPSGVPLLTTETNDGVEIVRFEVTSLRVRNPDHVTPDQRREQARSR